MDTFTPLFVFNILQHLRFKGKPTTDKWKYGYETVDDFKINYTNRTMTFRIFWQQPKHQVSNHIGVVVYNNKLPQSGIKRMLKKIEMEQFQVKKILIEAEKQLQYILQYIKFLSYTRRGIESTRMKTKNAKYIDDLKTHFQTYMEDYEPLKDYFQNLAGHKTNYELLMDCHKRKARCFECLQEKTKSGLVRQKNILVCCECIEEKKRRTTKVDCPICLESFSGDEVIQAGCGNGHGICNACFIQLSRYSNKCPMCRGAL